MKNLKDINEFYTLNKKKSDNIILDTLLLDLRNLSIVNDYKVKKNRYQPRVKSKLLLNFQSLIIIYRICNI